MSSIDLIDDLEAGELSVEFEGQEPWDLLGWAIGRFGAGLSLSTAFQEGDVALIDMAYARDIPLVATNECFFADEDMFTAHDALICLAEKSFVSISNRRRLTPHHRFKTAEEMEALFAEVLPRVQRLRGEFEAETRPLLGPEQNRRLDEFLAGRPRPSGSPGVGTAPPPRG